MPGEELRGMVTGLYSDRNGVLAATNRRLLFFDKRLTGEQIEDFPYKGIGSIQHETGLFGGTISITAAGRKTKIKHVPVAQVRRFCDIARAQWSEHVGAG